MRSPTLFCTVQSAITKFDARTERRCQQIVPSRPPLVGADAQEIDPDGTESGGENGVRGVARNEDWGGFYRQVVKVLWYHTSSEFRVQTSDFGRVCSALVTFTRRTVVGLVPILCYCSVTLGPRQPRM